MSVPTSVLPFSLDVSNDSFNINCIKHGIIEFHHPITVDYPFPEKDDILLGIDLKEDNERELSAQTLCLINIPSYMIPGDILRFFNTFLKKIRSFRVFRHYYKPEKYMAIIYMDSHTSGLELLFSCHNQLVCSISKIYCQLCPVKRIKLAHSNDELALTHFQLENIPSGISVLKETSSQELLTTLCSRTISDDQSQGEDETCPVCLEPFQKSCPMTFITYCNHKFHLLCVIKLEQQQCPVCRFQHDSKATIIPKHCFTCGSDGFTPPISSSETAGGLSTATFFPSRDLWVCLICGFTGCGGRNTLVDGNAEHHGPVQGSHSELHYEESLHSYVMGADHRRVWDFGRGDFIHSLFLENNHNTSEHTSSASQTRVSLNNRTNNERNLMMENDDHDNSKMSVGGIEEKENEEKGFNGVHMENGRDLTQSYMEESDIVHRKLEAVADHYNRLLAWRMQQNRLLYETRLQKIRDSVALRQSIPTGFETSSIGENSGFLSKGTGQNVGKNWQEGILLSLKSEKQKIMKQVESAKVRLRRSQKEVEVLRELNNNFKRNEEEWENRVKIAEEKLNQAEVTYHTEVPLLEEKVQMLMEKLDKSNTTGSSSGATKTNSRSNCSVGDDES